MTERGWDNLKMQTTRYQFGTDVRLISEVEKHPCIYDVSHPQHRDSPAKDSTWLQIGHSLEVGPEFCKLRWKSIRDRFVKREREDRLRLAGGYPRKAVPYRFNKHLGFLKEYMRIKNWIDKPTEEPHTPFQDDDNDDDTMNDSNTPSGSDIVKVEDCSGDSADEGWAATDGSPGVTSPLSPHHPNHDDHQEGTQNSGSSSSVGFYLAKRRESQDERVINYLDGVSSEASPHHSAMSNPTVSGLDLSVTAESDLQPYDEILHFLVSLAPAMRRLSAQRQSIARIKIQTLLHELEFTQTPSQMS